jgi:hypothetical protein
MYNELKVALQLQENTKKRGKLFCQEAVGFLQRHPLPSIKWGSVDVILLWDDVRGSMGFVDSKTDFEYRDDTTFDNTNILINKHFRELDDIIDINRTHRLINWYSIFRVPMIEFLYKGKSAYEPSKEEYNYYFTLRGNIDSIEELIDGDEYYFYNLVHRLFTKQARELRPKVLKQLLSDPQIVENIEHDTYILPDKLNSLLNLSQVHSYYATLKIAGKELPLKPPSEPIIIYT